MLYIMYFFIVESAGWEYKPIRKDKSYYEECSESESTDDDDTGCPVRPVVEVPTLPSFTIILLASQLDRSLVLNSFQLWCHKTCTFSNCIHLHLQFLSQSLPEIWWKTHIDDNNSIQCVKLLVADNSWNVYVKIKNETVKIVQGWSRFVANNNLAVGTMCKFELLPVEVTTFRVTF